MYLLLQPHPALLPCAAWYWILRGRLTQGETLQETLFVDTRSYIIFNYGSNYDRYSLLTPAEAEPVATSILYGQRDYPMGITQQGDICSVGIGFAPGGLAAFMPVPAHELGNAALTPDSVFGIDIRDLRDRVYDVVHDSAAVKSLLDSFLLARLQRTHTYEQAHYLAQHLAETDGTLRIQHLSEIAGYSIRSVDRLFRRIHGVTPKYYARVLRFQRALPRVRHTQQPFTQIALACGYSDNAHFSREFKVLTGFTPRQYRQQIQAGDLSNFFKQTGTETPIM